MKNSKWWHCCSLAAGTLLGWYVAYFNYDSQATYASEELIGNEIRLLEQANAYRPPCSDLLSVGSVAVTKHDNNVVVLWKKSSEAQLDKMVIDNNFHSAAESVASECQPSS
jgi:hypothetical protein